MKISNIIKTNMMNEEEIVYLTISDWDNYWFDDEKIYEDFLNIFDKEEIWFNYKCYVVDQAMEFIITTTKKDLIEHGFEKLIHVKNRFTYMCGRNFENPKEVMSEIFPSYNPDVWNVKGKNGNLTSYEKCVDIIINKYNKIK